jgi:hypothetical protein
MLPDIPDNDTSTCWAPGCKGSVATWTESGLCRVHSAAIRNLDPEHPTGRLFDLLGMRLNVLQETNRACLLDPGPCDLRICRFHADDYYVSHEHPEPCTIKLAALGGMTLDEVAAVSGRVTRERARQLEISGLRHLKRACEKAGIKLEDVVGVRVGNAA